jgi:hypothetical protein
LSRQEKVTKEKATPNVAPCGHPALRVRSRAPGFSGRTSMYVRKTRAHRVRDRCATDPPPASRDSRGPGRSALLRAEAKKRSRSTEQKHRAEAQARFATRDVFLSPVLLDDRAYYAPRSLVWAAARPCTLALRLAWGAEHVLSFLVTSFFTRVKKEVTRWPKDSGSSGSRQQKNQSHLKLDSGFRRNDERRVTRWPKDSGSLGSHTQKKVLDSGFRRTA